MMKVAKVQFACAMHASSHAVVFLAAVAPGVANPAGELHPHWAPSGAQRAHAASAVSPQRVAQVSQFGVKYPS